MAYLRLRRLLELAVLDRPGLAWLIGSRGAADRSAPAERWDGYYAAGTYDGLLAPWGGAWQVWTCRPSGTPDG